MLYIICDVCSTPRYIHQSTEWYLLKADYVYCPDCKQASEITADLKENVKERGIV